MTDFSHKYGVAFDDETAEEVERFLEEGDSRSARIRRLVNLGLIAEQVMLDNDWYPPSAGKREDMVREAMSQYIDEELA